MLPLPAQQDCRVGDDEHRTCVVDQGSYNWVQDSADGQGDDDEVEHHGECHIAFDRGHHPL